MHGESVVVIPGPRGPVVVAAAARANEPVGDFDATLCGGVARRKAMGAPGGTSPGAPILP